MEINSLHKVIPGQRLKVAAYARISSDKDVAETSLDEVIAAYSVYIVAYLKENNLYISEKTKATFNCYSKFNKWILIFVLQFLESYVIIFREEVVSSK